MSRLPNLVRADLDDDAAGVWETLVSVRGPEVFNDDGGLVGPFNAWLHAPAIGGHFAELATVLRFGTSLERRLVELAILVVGAHWKAEFEWWAHARMARQHGVGERVIDAIGRGETPSFHLARGANGDGPDDRDGDGASGANGGDEDVDLDAAVVYDVALGLVSDGRVEGEVYQRAMARFGPRGVVELVSLCGFYALVSFTLNAFEVPLPTGAEPMWRR